MKQSSLEEKNAIESNKVERRSSERSFGGCGGPTSEPVSSSNDFKSNFVALFEACKRKDLQQIRSLVEQKNLEILKQHDRHRRNILHYLAILIAEKGYLDVEQQQERCIECFKYLKELSKRCLENEAKTRAFWCHADLDGMTVLHFAVISCNYSLVKYLLFQLDENGLDGSCGDSANRLVRSLDKEGHSPLHWAVITNHLECVKLLINYSGVELVHVRDQNGATPLHYATQTSDYPKYRAQLRQMLRDASSSATSFNVSSNALAQSSYDAGLGQEQPVGGSQQQQQEQQQRKQSNSSDSLEVLAHLVLLPGCNLECLDNDRRTPLLWAASSGNWEAIRLLAGAGANLTARDASSLGALHCSASHGFTECLESMLSKLSAQFEKQQKKQQEHSRDITIDWVNQADRLNCTPLFYAILSGNIDCIELMVDRGAKLDWQDAKGRTVAHFAALKGQLNSLKLLEAHGANLWLANKQGDLPLHYAIKSGRQPVISWLLARSPYERAVNAINNVGRAPIHLAVLRNNAYLIEWLVERQGANVNQLVKLRERSTSTTNAERASGSTKVPKEATTDASVYKFETALDMAQRLQHWACFDLLERHGAQSAAQVLAARHQSGATAFASKSKATTPSAQLVSSCSTSAEPQQCELPAVRSSLLGDEPARVPRLPARPAPLNAQLPQSSDSSAPSGSSSLSQSSSTSVRGLHLPEIGASREPKQQQQQQQMSSRRPIGRPYKGGISYHNDHINASIKCKLYGTPEGGTASRQTGDLHQHSFPPLCNIGRTNMSQGKEHRCSHSTSSLDRVATTLARATSGPSKTANQEIITNVSVYTSPCRAHCAALQHQGVTGDKKQCERCKQKSTHSPSRRQFAISASESDSDATTSGTSPIVVAPSEEDETSVYEDNETSKPGAASFACFGDPGAPPLVQVGQPVSHQPLRFSGSAAHDTNFAHQLPVIMSAEEERSTSGETMDGHNVVRPQRASRPTVRSKYRSSQARSPVADYINSTAAQQHADLDQRLRSWSRENQHQQQSVRDYSHVKARVDSHRNDSGLSSAFGFATSGGAGEFDSPAGRRSKSLSTSSRQHVVSKSPQAKLTPTKRATEPEQARSCSRQTIIRTRRLSVDSVELASRVEKSIRKYKQETKLFEELQNLKRSQIRSGRANEALLVKRLIEHFMRDTFASMVGLDSYSGPYTYKAYELYLYDQLRKLSQSNRAKLAGDKVAHRFHYAAAAAGAAAAGSNDERQVSGGSNDDDDARDYLEEDLRAELELQRVINRDAGDRVLAAEQRESKTEDTIAIEPSGALEEIRVKRAGSAQSGPAERLAQTDQVDELESSVKKSVATVASADECDAEKSEERLRKCSLSSRRRSSIEIEREQLEKLPLRVGETILASETELGRKLSIENEACSLSSAIITDALGNVSRAGSPVRAARQSTHKQEDDQEDTLHSDAASSEWSPPASSGLQRRRSVVNIGNKLEVIYHNVGIEIEPVMDESELSDASGCPKGHERMGLFDGAPGEAAKADDSNKQRGIIEEVHQESEAINGETIASGQESSVAQVDKEQVGQTESLEIASPRASPISRRRVSSPPTMLIKKDQQKEDSFEDRTQLDARRLSESTGVDAGSTRKSLFTGYDLDKIHSRRSSAKQIGSIEESSPTDGGDQLASVSVQQSLRGKRSKRLHSERSRLPPRGSLKLQIPLDEIRARWNEIKRIEKFRKLQYKRDSLLISEKDTSKSQPNLNKSKEQKQQQQQHEDYQQMNNYVLIYELNKGSKRSASINNQQKATISQRRGIQSTGQWWCQRKITRIIDVRTLKRTLSLPESIMYSNELLKKFNVLKL